MSYFSESFMKAFERIYDIFAVELREVNFSEPLYNLIGKLKLPNNGRIHAGKGLPQTGFLMRFLHIIFIKHNSASSEDISKILKKKQIYSSK